MIMFMFTITVVQSPNSPGAGLTEEKIFYDTLKNLAIGPPPIKKHAGKLYPQTAYRQTNIGVR